MEPNRSETEKVNRQSVNYFDIRTRNVVVLPFAVGASEEFGASREVFRGSARKMPSKFRQLGDD